MKRQTRSVNDNYSSPGSLVVARGQIGITAGFPASTLRSIACKAYPFAAEIRSQIARWVAQAIARATHFMDPISEAQFFNHGPLRARKKMRGGGESLKN